MIAQICAKWGELFDEIGRSAYNITKYLYLKMRQPSQRPAGRLPQIDLVATKTPENMVVHTELGITRDPVEGIAFATKIQIAGVVDDIVYMSAEDVGLEWRAGDGKKIPQSAEWADGAYVAVSGLIGNEDYNIHGQLQTRRGIAKNERQEKHRLTMDEPEGDLKEWMAHLEKSHDLWERIKRGAS